MMFIAIISHTPIWVWFVLLYLLRTGYRGLSDQPVHIRRISLLPILFLILALAEIQNTPEWIWVWLGGVFIGTGIGYLLFHSQIESAYYDANQQICLPGRASLLMLMLTVFILHYLLAVLSVTRPSDLWEIASITISGLTNGAFGYRAIKIFRQYTRFRPACTGE